MTDKQAHINCEECGSRFKTCIPEESQVVADTIKLIECPICQEELVEA
jgi:transcription elongation factor Elf1